MHTHMLSIDVILYATPPSVELVCMLGVGGGGGSISRKLDGGLLSFDGGSTVI